MAYYTLLDENNIVVDVISGKDETKDNVDWESFYGELNNKKCKRTSYNTMGGIHYDPETRLPSDDQSKSLRKNYAGIGYTYDESLDAFIAPKPFNSWQLNEETCLWEPPVPLPEGDEVYLWNEKTVNWEVLQIEE